MGASKCLPRIFLGCLEGQGHALAVQVHLENLDGNGLANLDNLGRVVDVLPGQLGNVNQTVHATQVHECTEVDDGGDNALADLTLLQLVEEGGANSGLSLFQVCTAGQNNVVAVLVQLDDLSFDLLTDVRCEVADAAHLNEGCGQEATQTDVEDKATLDNLDNGTGNDAVVFLDLLDVAPCTLVLCALLGEDQATFLVLLGEDECLNLGAELDNLRGVDVVLDGQLAGGDDAFGLVTDVEQNLIVVDLNDLAGDEIAVVEDLNGLLDSLEECLLVADVVDCDLRDVGAHVVRAPIGFLIGRRFRFAVQHSRVGALTGSLFHPGAHGIGPLAPLNGVRKRRADGYLHCVPPHRKQML